MLDLSSIPMLATLIVISAFGFIVLIIALSRTKTATKEARIGHYKFILLPSGKQLSGVLTLARGLVSEEYTYELARTKTIKDDEAKKLQEAFDKFYFYALRSGRKYLIVSAANLESPEFAKVLGETFDFPHGFIAKRLVVGDSVETERGGWKIVVITPRSLTTDLSPETFGEMAALGDAAACVKELAVRVKKELPWKEVAEARERQLKEAQNKFAESEAEKAEMRIALGREKLLVSTGLPLEAKTKMSITRGFPLWRVLVSFIASLFGAYLILQYYPQQDPMIPAGVIFIVALLLYPAVKKRLSKWF